MTTTERPGSKKPYLKPEYRKVPLRPEEAVLGSCKIGGAAGPVGSTCAVPIACSASGS